MCRLIFYGVGGRGRLKNRYPLLHDEGRSATDAMPPCKLQHVVTFDKRKIREKIIVLLLEGLEIEIPGIRKKPVFERSTLKTSLSPEKAGFDL